MNSGQNRTSLDYTGRLVVVTGGGSGIGATASASLADAGAEVIVADLDFEAATTVARCIGGTAMPVDVCDRSSVVALFASLARSPDALLTCAGGAYRCPALDVDDELLFESLQLNTGGFWRCAQEAARRSIAERRPLAIAHVASSLYAGPAPGLSHFAAAKGASISLVRCLAQEWAAYGIRVNAIIPGPIDTPATESVWDKHPEIRAAIEARIPMGRVGRTADLIPIINWLLHDSTDWVTGSLITVDGGWSVAP
jgi:NAD(P)-dependent dehydrogenase (short-subunit alcohol dehydrogenase family)